jgi:hypothetical protein
VPRSMFVNGVVVTEVQVDGPDDAFGIHRSNRSAMDYLSSPRTSLSLPIHPSRRSWRSTNSATKVRGERVDPGSLPSLRQKAADSSR